MLLLLLSGCSGLPKLSDKLASRVELTDTPFFPQEEYQCGPAALATVLNYRGIEVTPEELTPQVYLPERKGSLQIELVAAVREYGLLAYPMSGYLNDLLTEVAAGNPVLVLQNLAFDWLPKWHYAVVVGYDLGPREVILRSGRERRWRSGMRAFNNTWRRADRWALVILPPQRIPRTATPEIFLKAAYDLEATNNAKAAHEAYRAASERWPDNKHTWLALGNSAFGLNLWNETQAALQQALMIDPADTTALNNLAYVYLSMGCGAEAKASIAEALRLQPDDENLLDSKREIESKTSLSAQGPCRIPADK